MAGYVYFIQAGSGPIKIGWASDPLQRQRELQVGNHECLMLLGVVEGTIAHEREMQRQFDAFRIRGEWFWPAKPLLDRARAAEVSPHIVRGSLFSDWYEARCMVGELEAVRCRMGDLYDSWRDWVIASGVSYDAIGGVRDFGSLLDARGHRARKSNGVKVRLGIALRPAMASASPYGEQSGDDCVIRGGLDSLDGCDVSAASINGAAFIEHGDCLEGKPSLPPRILPGNSAL